MAIPGDGSELETMLEYFSYRGKTTGLVTTTYMTHATPAGFGAHEPSRDNLPQIAGDYLNQTRPNVIFGGGANGLSIPDAVAAGYTVVTDRAEMQALDLDSVTLASGQFGSTHFPYEYDYFMGIDDGYDTLPHLSEMTTSALDILDADPDGFFSWSKVDASTMLATRTTLRAVSLRRLNSPMPSTRPSPGRPVMTTRSS
jgi:alkaline phosphatase